MRMPSFSLIFSISARYCSTRGATFSFSSASAGCAASDADEGRTPSNLPWAQEGSGKAHCMQGWSAASQAATRYILLPRHSRAHVEAQSHAGDTVTAQFQKGMHLPPKM